MANSLANVQQIAQQTFVDGLASSTEDYARCCEVLDYEGGTARLMASNAGGLATAVSSATTAVAASDLTSGISSIDQQAFALKHSIPWAQLNWSMNLAEDVGRQLANAAAQNINKLFFDGLESTFTLPHPMANAAAGGVGVGQAFCDTGQGYALTTPAAGVQNNLGVAALAEASLSAARSLLREYRNQQALPMNMGAGEDLVLVVGPENERVAKELITSELSGADMQSNTFRQYADVVVYPLTVDGSDWWLLNKRLSPVGIWMSEAPTLITRESDDGLFVNFVARFHASFYVKAYEYGIIGNNVP